ncbi:aminopeptidase [Staphylococcus lutrae]|uniref:Aminopeptidase n=1 Tax=Staphylococcus lutrae TaxID=155085 RepID=A0AAC9WIN4_9STAP|nr:aminopeptidase [Staphylococcus lutrae]ARJ50145.1 aminopeptidase [Staphylococcus lutrae]PNZ38075.1 aminopeptidase [Staphylococcus lutrae]
MTLTQRLQQYATLLVRFGMNVQKGQPVFIRASVETIEFTRMIVKEAYEAGASDVRVDYSDPILQRLAYEYEPVSYFEHDLKPYDVEERMDYVHRGACQLALVSADPHLLNDIAPEKIKTAQLQYAQAFKPYMMAAQKNSFPWLVAAYPTPAWAQRVYPDLNEEEAMSRFLEDILSIVRVDGNDPIKNWEQHVQNLKVRAKQLNDKAYKALHFVSEGTDLHIGLPEGHIWEEPASYTENGQVFVANIPTEEVFTAPDCRHVNGYVTNTRPLSYNGAIIDGFKLTFEEGKVVAFEAEKGETVLADLLNTDEGARRLGEVALVPVDSPISNKNMIFYNTLFDENASCHIALGAAYAFNLQNGTTMTSEELQAHGLNDSLTHVDFMIGSRDLNIYGIKVDGTEEQVFKNGNWLD